MSARAKRIAVTYSQAQTIAAGQFRRMQQYIGKRSSGAETDWIANRVREIQKNGARQAEIDAASDSDNNEH